MMTSPKSDQSTGTVEPRVRSINFTVEEKKVLTSLIAKHPSINTKFCDNGSLSAKHISWSEVYDRFCAKFPVQPLRDIKQLKGCWKRLKMKRKMHPYEPSKWYGADDSSDVTSEKLTIANSPNTSGSSSLNSSFADQLNNNSVMSSFCDIKPAPSGPPVAELKQFLLAKPDMKSIVIGNQEVKPFILTSFNNQDLKPVTFANNGASFSLLAANGNMPTPSPTDVTAALNHVMTLPTQDLSGIQHVMPLPLPNHVAVPVTQDSTIRNQLNQANTFVNHIPTVLNHEPTNSLVNHDVNHVVNHDVTVPNNVYQTETETKTTNVISDQSSASRRKANTPRRLPVRAANTYMRPPVSTITDMSNGKLEPDDELLGMARREHRSKMRIMQLKEWKLRHQCLKLDIGLPPDYNTDSDDDL